MFVGSEKIPSRQNRRVRNKKQEGSEAELRTDEEGLIGKGSRIESRMAGIGKRQTLIGSRLFLLHVPKHLNWQDFLSFCFCLGVAGALAHLGISCLVFRGIKVRDSFLFEKSFEKRLLVTKD